MMQCLDCGELTAGTRCEGCRKRTDNARYSRRGNRTWYDSRWRAISKAARAAQPYCSVPGCTNMDLQVDHIEARSLAKGITVLCVKHHREKTERDRRNNDD